MAVLGKVLLMAVAAEAVKTKQRGPGFLGRATRALVLGASAAQGITDPTDRAHIEHLVALEQNPSLMRDAFHDWCRDHHKDYVIGHDHNSDGLLTSDEIFAKPGFEELYEARYNAFSENVAKANVRNAKGGATHGITKFMDMPYAEFKARMTGTKPKQEDLSTLHKWSCSEAKGCKAGSSSSVDWRQHGLVTDVKDQGHCGSCWAFSVTEEMESAALRDGLFDKEDPFIGAPQELVNCDDNDNGCHGGNPITAYKFMKGPEGKALEPESDDPYMSGITGHAGRCHYESSDGVLKVESYELISQDQSTEATDMRDYVTQTGPAAVAVYAEPFQTYIGGKMTVDECGVGETDHAVQAVGYVDKADEDGFGEKTGYWIVRNSWGPDWGEDGFIRLEFGSDACNIADMVTGVTVKKVDSAGSADSSRSAVVV